jgi:hypothetical protein
MDGVDISELREGIAACLRQRPKYTSPPRREAPTASADHTPASSGATP